MGSQKGFRFKAVPANDYVQIFIMIYLRMFFFFPPFSLVSLVSLDSRVCSFLYQFYLHYPSIHLSVHSSIFHLLMHYEYMILTV